MYEVDSGTLPRSVNEEPAAPTVYYTQRAVNFKVPCSASYTRRMQGPRERKTRCIAKLLEHAVAFDILQYARR